MGWITQGVSVCLYVPESGRLLIDQPTLGPWQALSCLVMVGEDCERTRWEEDPHPLLDRSNPIDAIDATHGSTVPLSPPVQYSPLRTTLSAGTPPRHTLFLIPSYTHCWLLPFPSLPTPSQSDLLLPLNIIGCN